MKTPKDINRMLSKLNGLDNQKIKEISQSFEEFSKRSEISVAGLKTLYNIQTSIQTLTEQYNDRLLHLMRQDHMVD
tara:strand:- start:8115 stop:8342 length:228 start_codon:yes stop_codon:yes gene_type:complete